MRHLPNALSVFRGLLAAPIVFYTIRAGDGVPVVAVCLLVVAWVADGMDGWLARRLNAQSELGRILDPLADKLVVDGTAVALWIGGRIPTWLAAVIVGRDVAILALAIPMKRYVGRVPRASTTGKVAVFLLILTLAAYLLNVTSVTGVLSWVSLAAVVASGASYGWRFIRVASPGCRESRPV